jgi:hypothetical protein
MLISRQQRHQRAEISNVENCTPKCLGNKSSKDGGLEDESSKASNKTTARLLKQQERFDSV